MPKSAPNPKGLQEAAKRYMAEPITFTRDDGTPVQQTQVPEVTRQHLESARKGFLQQIASSDDFATRMDEAVGRGDKDAVVALAKEAGLPRDMKFSVVDIDPDFRCTCRGCIFGICCSCSLSW
jgi:hypothetical protein